MMDNFNLLSSAFRETRSVSMRNINGLTLLEIVVTISLAAVVMGAIVTFMDRTVHFKGTADTLQRMRKIESAFEVLYRENIRYVEDTCYGWTDPNNSCNTLTVLPGETSDPKKLTIVTQSVTALDAFRQAGCTLTPDQAGSNTSICRDGYGGEFSFAITNVHSAGSLYLNGYNRTPYSVNITAGGNTSISDTWNSGHLDSDHMVRSQEKILTISRAMKSYHLGRLTYEAISNPCAPGSGGLASNDDVLIPWIWQALGQGSASRLACSGATSGSCGCSVLSASWVTNAAQNIINTNTAMINFVAALNTGPTYRVDGFGNPIEIRLLTDASGASPGSAPPPPGPGWNWPVTPPYAGMVGIFNSGVAVYTERVVYPQ